LYTILKLTQIMKLKFNGLASMTGVVERDG